MASICKAAFAALGVIAMISLVDLRAAEEQSRPQAPATALGVDVDFYTGAISRDVWLRMKQAGQSFAIVQAWGGRSRNEFAAAQLSDARSIAEMKTAAYVLLNYDDKVCPSYANPRRDAGGKCSGNPVAQAKPGGRWQVEQGLAALGTELANVSFVAVDVEWFLKDPPSPTAAARARRRQTVLDAIAAVREKKLRPVIYTRNATRHWADITGCEMGSDAPACVELHNTINDPLNRIPLWDVQTGQAELHNFAPHGAWNERKGRQYRLDANVFGLPAGRTMDLNIFDVSVFGD
jgi:hypothetical protein